MTDPNLPILSPLATLVAATILSVLTAQVRRWLPERWLAGLGSITNLVLGLLAYLVAWAVTGADPAQLSAYLYHALAASGVSIGLHTAVVHAPAKRAESAYWGGK